MPEIPPKIKTGILVILGLIIIILLITLGIYWYFQKQISQIKLEKEKEKIEIPPLLPPASGMREGIEQEIERGIENCRVNFDLNKLDFAAPIWNTELSSMLPQLIAMQAFEQSNEKKCDYFKNKDKINPGLTVENCQRRYHFLKLIAELKKGLNCQDFVGECARRNIPDLDVEKDELEKANKIVCESLCQSYQNRTPVIPEPEVLCDAPPSPQTDAVDYLDPETNQLKTCLSGTADEIKFLIAASQNEASGCLIINNPRTSQFCQFYFDRDLEKQQNKFKEIYCRNLVEMVIIPPE